MRSSLVSLAAALALLAAPGASAQGYVGGGIGWTQHNVDCSSAPGCDRSDTGGKVYAGWHLTRAWSLEFGYLDWGRAAGFGGASAMRLRGTGIGLDVAYAVTQPDTDWSGVVRFGVLQNKAELSATAGSSQGLRLTKRSGQPYLGIGVGYRLTRDLTLTGEADFSRLKIQPDNQDDYTEVQMFTIGVRYAF